MNKGQRSKKGARLSCEMNGRQKRKGQFSFRVIWVFGICPVHYLVKAITCFDALSPQLLYLSLQ